MRTLVTKLDGRLRIALAVWGGGGGGGRGGGGGGEDGGGGNIFYPLRTVTMRVGLVQPDIK